jgi:NADH-quinone oxidoreductase subunit L
VVSFVVAVSGTAAGYLWFFKGVGFHGITERNKAAATGYRILQNKYYFDHVYTGFVAGGVKGPVARGANWFNQKGIDGVINGAGAGAVRSGGWIYKRIDQGFIEGAVNGSGRAVESSGQGARRMQTGKVQQYAAWLFAGAAVLAGAFIILI